MIQHVNGLGITGNMGVVDGDGGGGGRRQAPLP